MNSIRACTFIPILVLATSCNGGHEPAPSPSGSANASSVSITPADRKEAMTLFSSLCVTCHGDTGHGDGPGAAAIDPKPRSFADPAWQDSVTDSHIQKVILLGGAAVGKSPMMPAQPQLKGKHAVLAAIVEKIRSYRGK